MVRRSLAFPITPRHPQDASKTATKRPRGPQDRPKTPKRTPKAPPKSSESYLRDLQKPLKKSCILQVFSDIQPLLFVSFSMLIKIELQMAFRSVQKRPRTPQDARPPPTWSQHGPNMGSKRSAKIGPRGLEIWSRGGLRPESLSDFNMDPKRTPKCTPNHPKTYPEWTPNRLPNRLQMDHPSTAESTSKALSNPFPDPAIHEQGGRVGS